MGYKIFRDYFEKSQLPKDLFEEISRISSLQPQKLLDELEKIPKEGKVDNLEFKLYNPENLNRKLAEAVMERAINANAFLKDLGI